MTEPVSVKAHSRKKAEPEEAKRTHNKHNLSFVHPDRQSRDRTSSVANAQWVSENNWGAAPPSESYFEPFKRLDTIGGREAKTSTFQQHLDRIGYVPAPIWAAPSSSVRAPFRHIELKQSAVKVVGPPEWNPARPNNKDIMTMNSALDILGLSAYLSVNANTLKDRLIDLVKKNPQDASAYATAYDFVNEHQGIISYDVLGSTGRWPAAPSSDGWDTSPSDWGTSSSLGGGDAAGNGEKLGTGEIPVPPKSPKSASALSESATTSSSNSSARLDEGCNDIDEAVLPVNPEFKVMYWATVDYGAKKFHVPIDHKNVFGPEKEIIDTGMRKAWEWFVEANLANMVNLQDAYDLAKHMQGVGLANNTQVEMEAAEAGTAKPEAAKPEYSIAPSVAGQNIFGGWLN